ncbi:uncharacterized protein CDV56_100420 [Aspergillus thermomutatus]|uniref:Uncharacterized protein n=1 Tax=Aspergillus thermomutatus TaxID=41047 RepID=A0A397H1G4_ASPTH|nr:uncharacterized protein CDV56_100420 [Aspergillus thermomutatus]RHZ55203.1 hypothetical protein CDV56_100420 [Aspergillus thermomutatus]
MDDGSLQKPGMGRTAVMSLTSIVLLVSLLVCPARAAIPYSPSHILYTPHYNGSFAYLLRPSDLQQNATQFLSLNVSGKVDAASPEYTVLLDELPFRTDNQSSAFVPAIDQRGHIKVYGGDCRQSLQQGRLWVFTPSVNNSSGNGTWEKRGLDLGQRGPGVNNYGPNYLSAAFAWASSNMTESLLYTFGGMCPFNASSKATWIYAANYSQSTIVLSPPTSDRITSYRISTAGQRAPPIPEAGFTITPLQPTYALSPLGRTLHQQNFLFIGGHTQKAFINMSELAIYSLPQDSWSFVAVDSGLDAQKTELAVRDSAFVEPRSGHTAVLSPDGSKVIVFGGWVGSTGRPANPQLAILEMGEEYGGTGSWRWVVPSNQGSGLSDGAGIYGHGAAMLPGGVMMIAGGYSTSTTTKRSAAGPQPNSRLFLYNVTSGSWLTSYRNPSLPESVGASGGSTSSLSKKAGLGAGLGLGIPSAAGLAVLAWFYWRRRRLRRTRDRELRKLALSAQRAHYWGRDEPDMASSIRMPKTRDPNRTFSWTSAGSQNGQDKGEAAAESTSLLRDIPAPNRNSQQSLGMRPYRYSGPYSEYRRSDAAGEIHPIDERDEEETNSREFGDPKTAAASESFLGAEFVTPRSTMSNSLGIPYRTVRAEPAEEPRKDGLMPSDQDERTSSNLSDSSTSARSGSSAPPLQGPLLSPTTLPDNGRDSPEMPPSTSTHGTGLSREKRYSSDSYSTAHTTLSLRWAEGEHLLKNDPEPHVPTERPSMMPLQTPKTRTSGWMGSVRRVLSGTQKRVTAIRDSTTASLASGIDRRSTVLGARRVDGAQNESKVPRRAVSASAELFRRKQGARDWGASNRVSRDTGLQTIRSSRDDLALDGLIGLDDEDWDVEGAAEGRRVQMTFTVPKERLRVVNATAEDLENMSEKSISRSNSGA